MIIESQAIGSAYIPNHKVKINFIDYYENYIKENRPAGNRQLETSLIAFKRFIKKDFISAGEITENACETFRITYSNIIMEKRLPPISCDLNE